MIYWVSSSGSCGVTNRGHTIMGMVSQQPRWLDTGWLSHWDKGWLKWVLQYTVSRSYCRVKPQLKDLIKLFELVKSKCFRVNRTLIMDFVCVSLLFQDLLIIEREGSLTIKCLTWWLEMSSVHVPSLMPAVADRENLNSVPGPGPWIWKYVWSCY